jgi:hypothetical protein
LTEAAEKLLYSKKTQAKTPTPQRRINSLHAGGVGLWPANLLSSAASGNLPHQGEADQDGEDSADQGFFGEAEA